MNDTPPSPFDDRPGQVPPPPPAAPPGGTFSPPPPPPPPPSSSPGPHDVPPGYVAYGSPSAPPTGPSIASAGRRIVARLLDALIVGIVFAVIALVVGGINEFSFGTVTTSDVLLFQLFTLVASVAYEAAFLATVGATPGKMALSVKVVYEDRRELDLQGALMRLSTNIVFGLVALVPALAGLANLGSGVVGIVSIVFLFSDDRRRTVWDRIANTIVVNA